MILDTKSVQRRAWLWATLCGGLLCLLIGVLFSQVAAVSYTVPIAISIMSGLIAVAFLFYVLLRSPLLLKVIALMCLTICALVLYDGVARILLLPRPYL